MLISDLVTDKEKPKTQLTQRNGVPVGALTKENYLDSIRKAGFQSVEVLEEKHALTIK